MIFELPLVHAARIIPKGHRVPKEAGVLARIPVDIRSVDSAPVVAIMQEEGRVPTLYRRLDGALWSSYTDRPDVSPDRFNELLDYWERSTLGDSAVGRVHHLPAYGLHDELDGPIVPTAKFEIPITRLDELSFREWVSDDSGEIVQDVRARAMNDMAFIGGIMHWRTKGPFYRVYGDSPGIQARHHIETAGLLSRPLCFRADRLDDARAFLEPHIGGRQPKVDTLIDVMDPDAYRDLAFDERADMTRALHRVAVWAADSETLSRIADERSRNSACNRADLKAAAFAYMSPAGLRAQAALMRIPVQSPDFIWDNRTLDSVGASLAALDAELPVKDNQQTRLTRFTEQWVSREGFERGLATMSEPRP